MGGAGVQNWQAQCHPFSCLLPTGELGTITVVATNPARPTSPRRPAVDQPNRRAFLADVARGMVVASVGSSLAADLLPNNAFADGPETLNFGQLEPLVALMQDTPPARLLPMMVERLRQGTE